MGDFNKVMILGRLTRDPEIRYTPSGTPVCDIGIAVGRKVGGGESGVERRDETTYVDVTLWRRQAELAGQYLAKGRELFVEGRLELDTWEDKNTGQKRSRLKVVCENMQFIGGNGGGNSGGGAQRAQYQNEGGGSQAPTATSRPASNFQQESSPPPAFESEDDDDIPF